MMCFGPCKRTETIDFRLLMSSLCAARDRNWPRSWRTAEGSIPEEDTQHLSATRNFLISGCLVRCSVGSGARSARDLNPWLTRPLRAGLSLFRPLNGAGGVRVSELRDGRMDSRYGEKR